MTWPTPTDYRNAIQNPASCFTDPELAPGQSAADLLGLPLMYAGNFSSVYKLHCPGAQTWAVKCFTRQVSDLQERYAAISTHLERARRKFASPIASEMLRSARSRDLLDFHHGYALRRCGVWYTVSGRLTGNDFDTLAVVS